MVLDIVVTDIPPKFGMLVSRSYYAKLGGSYKLICLMPLLQYMGGEHLRLYREVRFMNTVCRSDQARNNPIYAIDQDFGCF